MFASPRTLPARVSEALEGTYPQATYKELEEVSTVQGHQEKLAYYEVVLVTAQKKTVEVKGSAEAEIVKQTTRRDVQGPPGWWGGWPAQDSSESSAQPVLRLPGGGGIPEAELFFELNDTDGDLGADPTETVVVGGRTRS